MQNVLADLCVESEASTALALRVARAYDEGDLPFRRLATAVAKYWICKVTPAHVAEALECVGGNGYVEESVLPRLHRESPLNSLWEGAGNINCLDVLRVTAKTPEALDALPRRDRPRRRRRAAPRPVRRRASGPSSPTRSQLEARARRIVERLALALQGSLLVRHSEPAVADAFCASRLAGDARPGVSARCRPGVDHAAIVERHRPVNSE